VFNFGCSNYRAACRARTKAEFVAKVGVVVEESDEAVLWLELLTESGILQCEKTDALLREAKELTVIFTASQNSKALGLDFSITKLPDYTITQ
jgi:four helix bundle protein